MAAKVFKARLVGYRVLAVLLYHKDLPFIHTNVDGSLTVQVGPLSRYLTCSVGKTKEQFQWLKDSGFAKWVVTDTGIAHLKLNYPTEPKSFVGVPHDSPNRRPEVRDEQRS